MTTTEEWLIGYGIVPYAELVLALDEALVSERERCAYDIQQFCKNHDLSSLRSATAQNICLRPKK